MKKKKRASTYIIVVFMASAIITVGTAVLTLVTADVKARVEESRQIQNLYGSDSNLDLVYSIILKNSDAAVNYANAKVYKEYGNNESINYNKLNKDFKKYFLEFLGDGASSEEFANITTNTLYYGIVNRKYMLYTKSEIEDNDDVKKENRANKGYYNMQDIKYNNGDTDIQESKIKVTSYVVDSKNNKITIQVESTFNSKITAVHKLSNERTISTKYTIKAPDYADDIKRDAEKVAVNKYQVQSGLYVDKNLYVDKSDLTINGVTWVKGQETSLNENSYYAYDKYNNGIKINEGTLNVNGNLSTNETLSLSNKGQFNSLNGNVYVENLYLGPGMRVETSEKELYKDNSLKVNNDVVTNNDLTMDAKNSNIAIDGSYYGISDKSENKNGNKKKAAYNSSSIIINTNDNSTININKDAYLCGLAYMDFNDDKSYYKTGESIAIIGNYEAYTKKVKSESYKDSEYNFSSHKVNGYDNPLELIELANSDNDTEFKTNHFIEYYTSEENTIRDGGINIGGDVYTLGAGNYKDSKGNKLIKKSSLLDNFNVNDEINKRKAEYGINVFNLGFVPGSDGKDIYDNVINDEVSTNEISENLKTLESQINFDSLPKNNEFKNFNKNNTINEKFGYSILDGDNKNKDFNVLILENGVLKSKSSSGEEVLMDLKSHDPNYLGKIKAVIITKGDFVIKGNNDIYGCVIVGGNLYVEGDGKNTINYDKNVIQNIMAYNNDTYKNIFKKDAYCNAEDKATIEIGEKDSILYTEDGWYDASTYLKCGLWKLKGSNGNVINIKNDKENNESHKNSNEN